MQRDRFHGIAGPAFVQTQLGEKISLEDLSGYKAHAIKSGCTHIVAADEKDAWTNAKRCWPYYPPIIRKKRRSCRPKTTRNGNAGTRYNYPGQSYRAL